METIDDIPITKIKRTGKIIETGAKIGVNYLKYYGNRLLSSEDSALEQLNKENAEDIYNGLKKLKGSALKAAQMMSMEKSLLPQAYVEKFSLSQFSVPPLSAPLVIKTFKSYFNKTPYEIFDEFEPLACNAASIGQVHKAKKDNQQLAIKIQYPGISESIQTDLKLVRPFAQKLLNISSKDSEIYFREVEQKLLEETNYTLELEQSIEIARACQHIPNIVFPRYYPELSSNRILTMDWMKGKHLSELNNLSFNKNEIGQCLWDFYMFQIHILKKVHADPHPGNFMLGHDKKLIVLDFGCMKIIPMSFYKPYFEMIDSVIKEDHKAFKLKLYELEILKTSDNKKENSFFTTMFFEILTAFATPFKNEQFDFSNKAFYDKIAKLSEDYAKNSELRNLDANRGSKHFIYVNRTFFGLFSLMNDLGSDRIYINNYKNL